MNSSLKNIISVIFEHKINVAIIIVLISFIIYEIIKRTINRILERDKKSKKLDKKGKTIVKLFTNIAKYVILTIAVALILQVYGVNINSLIAGLGLVSVIAGLAVQDPLKDIVTGINIITDDYYSLGDILKIDNIEGKVVQLGIRTTKIKDIKSGNLFVIANRNINKIEKLSDELYLDVPLSYEDEITNIEKILNKACETIQKLDDVVDAKYIGLSKFADSSIIYKIKIICKIENKFQIERNANRIIKLELDKNNISIPYPQITVHNGKNT